MSKIKTPEEFAEELHDKLMSDAQTIPQAIEIIRENYENAMKAELEEIIEEIKDKQLSILIGNKYGEGIYDGCLETIEIIKSRI